MKAKKVRSTRRALVLSFVSLMLCFAMLVGTTFAWFTDTVSSGINQIKAGNLDVELKHYTTSADSAANVDSETKLFQTSFWEPGVISYENFVVSNVGNLALKYQMKLNYASQNSYNSYNGHNLTEVLKAAVVPEGFSGDRAAAQALSYTPLSELTVESIGWLEAGKDSEAFGVVIYWEPTDHDNLYNVNNGGTTSDGEPLYVNLGVDLFATQKDFEEDSFDNKYDLTAADFAETSVKPVVKPLIVPVNPTDERVVRQPEDGETLTLAVQNQDMTVTYAVGTKLKEGTKLASDKKTADAELGFEFKSEKSNIGVSAGNDQKLANYELTLNIDQENAFLNKVTKKIPANLLNVVAYHNSNVAMDKLNEEDEVPTEKESYFYNPSTGLLTIWVFHASEVDVVYDLPISTDWYSDSKNEFIINTLGEFIGFAKLVNEGKTFADKAVKLGKSIDLSGIAWEPIGYSSYDKSITDADCRYFAGTFDGNNKTINGLTNVGYAVPENQKNGTEASFGLFGRISGATIKNVNLTNVNMTDVDWYTSENKTELGFTGAGALVGCACDEADILVENCHVSGNIIADNNVSGLFGWIQFSKLESGVEGQCNITIKDCTSSVDIVTGKDAGGIVVLRCDPQYDQTPNIKRNVNVINCVNNGNITSNDGNSLCFIAGIVCEQVQGNVYYPENLILKISGCTNNGNLSGTGSGGDRIVGGILCGKDNFDFSNEIISCKNKGTLTYSGNGFYLGGIASSAGFVRISDCETVNDYCLIDTQVYERLIVDTEADRLKCGSNGTVDGQILVLNTDIAGEVTVPYETRLAGTAAVPFVPTSETHTFAGWFTDTTYTTEVHDIHNNGNYTFNTIQSESIDYNRILYAKWEAK